jgi:transposase
VEVEDVTGSTEIPILRLESTPGIHHFAALSTGETIENPKFFREDEKLLATIQRRLSKERERYQGT